MFNKDSIFARYVSWGKQILLTRYTNYNFLLSLIFLLYALIMFNKGKIFVHGIHGDGSSIWQICLLVVLRMFI